MDYEGFVAKVKTCKPTISHTGWEDLHYSTNKDGTIKRISEKGICHCCKRPLESRKLFVKFKKPQQLTIFQGSLLWLVFDMGRKPSDYANYHNSEAGKEFIANIEDVQVMVK